MTRQNAVDLIRGGKLPEKPFAVCTDPDLIDEHGLLVAKRDAAKLADKATADLDEQVAALQEQIDEKTVTLRLRALGRRKFAALKDEHPPRRDDDKNVIPDDLFLGVNNATIWEPLVHKSIVEPELDAETIQDLIDEKLTEGQWRELTTICWNLNEKTISVPFSSAASPNRKRSARR